MIVGMSSLRSFSCICIFMYLLMNHSVSAISEAEDISIPLCKHESVPYNSTCMPNLLNHDSQEEAALEVHQFWPLIEIECSPYFRLFLCSVYAPVCTILEDPVPPCRELCQEPRRQCEPLMRQYGFVWPDALNCESFPAQRDNAICIWLESGQTSTSPAPPSVIPDVPTEGNCRPITTSFCTGHIPHNTTAAVEAPDFDMFIPLVEMNCSPPLLRSFLCLAYLPNCPHSGKASRPCREFCEKAITGCVGRSNQIDFVWPQDLNCELFPTQQEDSNCMMPDYLDRPTVTETEELGVNTENVTELLATFREKVNEIKNSMRELRAKNNQLQTENEGLREEVATLKEEQAASRRENVATMMDGLERNITQKLLQLETAIVRSSDRITNQIHQSCDD